MVKFDKCIPVSRQEVQRFDPQDGEGMRNYLDRYGYVVVASVADPGEVAKGRDLFWETLSKMPSNTPLSRDDLSTWHDGNWLPSPHNGILNGYGFGQSDFMWHLRLLPKVKEAFSAVWEGEEDLLVSFDGGNAFRPWSVNPSWITQGGWWHVDQNGSKKEGKVCVQGLVSLYDVDETTGGFCLIPGSHKEHTALCSRAGAEKHGRDFVPVPAGDSIFENGGILPIARAGDLVLWDSRTVHCNTPALTEEASGAALKKKSKTDVPTSEDLAKRSGDLIRLVGYVCMMPTKMASKETIMQRVEGFKKNASTTHWPNEFVGSSSMFPPTENDITKVSLEQRSLILGRDDLRASRCVIS